MSGEFYNMNSSSNLSPVDLCQGTGHDDDSTEDIFSILAALDGVSSEFNALMSPPPDEVTNNGADFKETGLLVSQKSTTSSISGTISERYSESTEPELTANDSTKSSSKKRKLSATAAVVIAAAEEEEEEANIEGQQKVSHITVERNRRKQMNDNLNVLRSLMPGFYVKRGDQASIVEGVVDYITELQQILQSLESKKQRKVYSDVLSPRFVPSPRTILTSITPLTLSPRKPPPSPRLIPSLPVSPRTPQPSSPYKHRLHQQPPAANNYLIPSPPPSSSPSPIDYHTSSCGNELVGNSKSAIADVEVKLTGPNVLLKTLSPRIPGQAVKIISALEHLSLEILNVTLTTTDDTMINSFTIKIGIECKLSAEELAHQIQQTFCTYS